MLNDLTEVLDGEKLSPAQYSSWAVYGSPDRPTTPYTKDSDLRFPYENIDAVLALLHTDFILLGLNPGNGVIRDPAWANFHVGGASKDERVAEACRETALWGSFITDLFPLEVNSSASDVKDKLSEVNGSSIDLQANVKRLEDTLDVLDVGNAQLICFGATTAEWAKRLLISKDRPTAARRTYTVAKVYHYSGANAHIDEQENTTGYARQVRKQIEDQWGTGAIDLV